MTGRRRSLVVAAMVTLGFVAGCAKTPPVVTPGPDRYPDYLFPSVPPTLQKAAPTLAQPHQAAWRALQAGDVGAAERGFSGVLKRRADYFPSEAGLGYVELARGRDANALPYFDRALGRAPQYLPALLGRGQALLRTDRVADALAAFEAALAVDPSLSDVRTRVETLRLRVFEGALADARRAEQAGDTARAHDLFQEASRASPSSGFLLRDLARLDRQRGRADEALSHLQEAIALDPSDGLAHLALADLHEARSEWDAALVALEKARELDAAPGSDRRLDLLRGRSAVARLPEEYRAIGASERLTRGELAALMGVRLERLLRDVPAGQAVLVTDARGHWAYQWILGVTRARVMEVFDNHTFQPRGVVRRGDLARAISGVLTLVARRNPSAARAWTGARRKFPDLGPENLYYPVASLAVAAGILDTTDNGAFQAGRVVTGAEAIEAVTRLEQLAARSLPRARP